ncbi:hypothetical protein CGRA01v4_07525 [Colletotrichum graminicola]|nr:hypothetical protein CGRA01v4_07525 [Colletotrichum graminicola]
MAGMWQSRWTGKSMVRRSYSGKMPRQYASTPQSGKWLRGLDCTGSIVYAS